MAYFKTPLGRSVFIKVAMWGAAVLLVTVPPYVYHAHGKLKERYDAIDRLRVLDAKSLSEALDAMTIVAKDALDIFLWPAILLSVGIVLLLVVAFLVSRPVDDLQLFMRDVIHDLRGPIASLKRKAHIALRKTNDVKHELEAILDSSTTILEIFDDNAEIARNYAGVAKEEAENVDFGDLLYSLVDMFRGAAEEKGVKISLSLPPVPVMLRAHRRKLQRMVTNLIDNAVKFTQAGCISVGLERTSMGRAKLTVADTGIGMTKDCQRKMHLCYYRADSADGRPGAGIGLPMVFSIVAFLKASIKWRSVEGMGTRFHIVFPASMTVGGENGRICDLDAEER